MVPDLLPLRSRGTAPGPTAPPWGAWKGGTKTKKVTKRDKKLQEISQWGELKQQRAGRTGAKGCGRRGGATL